MDLICFALSLIQAPHLLQNFDSSLSLQHTGHITKDSTSLIH